VRERHVEVAITCAFGHIAACVSNQREFHAASIAR
jgi:hypothetical protein